MLVLNKNLGWSITLSTTPMSLFPSLVFTQTPSKARGVAWKYLFPSGIGPKTLKAICGNTSGGRKTKRTCGQLCWEHLLMFFTNKLSNSDHRGGTYNAITPLLATVCLLIILKISGKAERRKWQSLNDSAKFTRLVALINLFILIPREITCALLVLPDPIYWKAYLISML